MVKETLYTLAGLFGFGYLNAQTGPNNPGSAANNTAVGSNAWSSVSEIYSSNNTYSSVSALGMTHYLAASGFGFAIPSSSSISGIRLEIEKSSFNPLSVAVLDNWTTGMSKTISAGTNRFLVVMVAMENGGGVASDITAMTYGGQAMILLTEKSSGTSFIDRIEVWYLPEPGITAASGTAIVPTFNAFTPTEYCETFSSVVFQNVDRYYPVNSIQLSDINGSTNPHQLGTPLVTNDGGMAINAVMCGNNTTPEVTVGSTNTYTINSSYTEGTDIYFANPGFSTSGGSFQTAHKLITTGGTEQPSCTFNGSVNRHLMIGIALRPAREFDSAVRLMKSGNVTGSNMATTALWSTTDSYASYGGATDLWGATWTPADINAPGFGSAISAIVQSGTARIDHVRITVYSISTLPVELLDFTVENKGTYADIRWITATETNNDYFLVQKSLDGIHFEDVCRVNGAGNSASVTQYKTEDLHLHYGTSYYRLVQVDLDGKFQYSDIKVMNAADDQMQVYPNPAREVINIYNAGPGIDEVAVYSTDLKLIKTSRWEQEKNASLYIDELSDGYYFLLIRTGSEQKLVKVLKESHTR